MAGKRHLTKAESEALAAAVAFLLKGYISPLCWKNGSLYYILAAYAICFMAGAALVLAGFSAMPVAILALAVAIGFAFYYHSLEQKEFEQLYQAWRARFAPPYQSRFALAAGRNKIYAYTIYGKQGLIKLGQTQQRTEDRITAQLRTADIRPEILWEIEAVSQSGRPFDDHALHRFLARNGYQRIKAANGRNTEWFQIGREELHKAVYKFYVTH
ncbi:MAG: GIY-YIG nuclease family protein [Candidatus Tokpelaia sp.]|nr:MAG: GIY-YIG nuclease family protein [Candidatus Tokpelaia sp.]KAA6206960.1 MAG: GIY-YIG nuclease family protein [Candidatus Tokpelaia sp.]